MPYTSAPLRKTSPVLKALGAFAFNRMTGLGDAFTVLGLGAQAYQTPSIMQTAGTTAWGSSASGLSPWAGVNASLPRTVTTYRAPTPITQTPVYQAPVAPKPAINVATKLPTTTTPVIKQVSDGDPYTNPMSPPTRQAGWKWINGRWVMTTQGVVAATPNPTTGAITPLVISGGGSGPTVEVGTLPIQSAGMFGGMNPMMFLAMAAAGLLLMTQKGR